MTRMTSSEAFVETLLAHGVKHIFGIVGSAYMDALDLFEPAGIRFISVAHEQGAGHMADGYSRVTNRQGVCIAQNGPGITNFVTAVAAAFVVLAAVMLKLHTADLIASYAPGSVDVMMILALALHLDPVFVGAHHLARIVIVSLALPLGAHLTDKRPPHAPNLPPPLESARETLED